MQRVASATSATSAAASAATVCVLVRERIRQALVDPKVGYFTKHGSAPVGMLQKPVNFNDIPNQRQYQAVLSRIYEKLNTAWLTPSELFQPHYGRAVAEHVLKRHLVPGAPLRIFEVGAGNGTAARDVLSHVRDVAPDVYATMRYTALEPSRTLAQRQRSRVAEAGHAKDRFEALQCEPFGDLDSARTQSWATHQPCVVLMLEVLDNLPHDRVVRQGSAWFETAVECFDAGEAQAIAKTRNAEDAAVAKRTWRGSKAYGAGYDGAGVEVLRPVEDALILHVLEKAMKLHGGGDSGLPGPSVGWVGKMALAARWLSAKVRGEEVFWIPTGALEAFRALRAALPRHSMIAADFDALPDVVVAGHGAPLVSTTQHGANIDHATYLVPPGEADIFFPVNFDAISALYQDVSNGARVEHMASRSFIGEHGTPFATRCRDGYDPMLDDFTNTRVFVGEAPNVMNE
ncbi:hypothetical protein PPROV_000720900 [Pycnococcus provasolii]|uniref:Protein arginine methyltransferase NDUFAF7 n=1 Tax=Pycnococcus provasolii TaxID=41880 RepID=A0A830HSL5_9CHLO|nr:hypothetical protein PPROV_000720900 [Pycnococcus provasolii]|mmetsp:Transcript_10130/g.27170  ORF Transcript_10130/g.27170 Transcript_10130/m.27170 type:complete len:459 (+) Transcript_10130:21-1397(+)